MAGVGERLRWVREALELTQAQIAVAVGIDQSAWSHYELGRRWPDIGTAMRLVAKLKISLPYLLDGSLEGVERQLAIRLAAYHPELVLPTRRDQHMDRLLA
jgi:transcriptional regulator with XRE-family HTH domain